LQSDAHSRQSLCGLRLNAKIGSCPAALRASIYFDDIFMNPKRKSTQ
jgi:hypothetical protein